MSPDSNFKFTLFDDEPQLPSQSYRADSNEQQQMNEEEENKGTKKKSRAAAAQSLYQDAIHSISAFLRNRDWLAASRTCHAWYAAACAPTGPNRRFYVSIAKRFDMNKPTSEEITIILRSPITRHISHLTCERLHKLTLAEYELVRSSLPQLVSFRVHLVEAKKLTTTTKVASDGKSTRGSNSDAHSDPFVVSSQLHRLEIKFDASLAQSNIDTFLTTLISSSPTSTSTSTLTSTSTSTSSSSESLDVSSTSARYPHLTYFELIEYPGSSMTLHPLTSMSQLRSFKLTLLETGDPTNFLHELRQANICFPQIESIDIGSYFFNVAAILHSISPHLTRLSSSFFSYDDFTTLPLFSQLTQLRLSRFHDDLNTTRSSSFVLDSICKCRSLTQIDFAMCLLFQVSADWFRLFSSLPQLTKLLLPSSMGVASSSLVQFLSSPEESRKAAGTLHLKHLTFYQPSPYGITCNENDFTPLKDLLNDTTLLPQLDSFSIDIEFDEYWFVWNRVRRGENVGSYRQENIKNASTESTTVTPPAAPLVGIELNPGPTSSSTSSSSSSISSSSSTSSSTSSISSFSSSSPLTAQNLFRDGLHSITSFLNNCEWLAASRTCHSWYDAGSRSSLSSSPNRRLSISFSNRWDLRESTPIEIDRLIRSSFNHHIAHLICEKQHQLTLFEYELVRSSLMMTLQSFRVQIERRTRSMVMSQQYEILTANYDQSNITDVSPRLQRLELIFDDSLTEDDIDQLLSSFSTSSSSSMTSSSSSSLSSSMTSSSRYPNLTDLHLFNYHGSIVSLRSFTSLPSLTTLTLYFRQHYRNFLNELNEANIYFPQLSSFNIGPNFTLDFLYLIAPNLTQLPSSTVDYSIEDFTTLPSFSHLTQFELSRFDSDLNFQSSSFKLSSLICECRSLTQLDVTTTFAINFLIQSTHDWNRLFSSLSQLIRLILPCESGMNDSLFVHFLSSSLAYSSHSLSHSLSLRHLHFIRTSSSYVNVTVPIEVEKFDQLKKLLNDPFIFPHLDSFLIQLQYGFDWFVWDREKNINTDSYRRKVKNGTTEDPVIKTPSAPPLNRTQSRVQH